MKKIIAIISVIILIISSVNVFSFYDIYDSDTDNAVDTLSSFNIINGYEDGSFRPNDYITRAEFSKIIISACDYEFNGYDENMRFYDVGNSHWAKNYIYIAKNLGIVNGVDERDFEPESNITYEQAVKMIVAALGYADKAERAGGYPYGYKKIAQELGITDRVNYSDGDIATRGNIALMVYNAMFVEYYTVWNDNGEIKRNPSELTLYEKHESIKHILENGGIGNGIEDSNVDSDYSDDEYENAVG